jgi:hypothetical protein
MKRKLIKIALVAVGFLVVALLIYNSKSVFALFSEGQCELPANSAFVQVEKGVYQVEGSDVDVFILRGIALGKPSISQTDSNDSVPACYTKEDGLQTIRNIYLIDKDGNKFALVKGVGSDSSLEQAGGEEEVPLP